MAGNIVLVCLFILVGIAGSSLTAEITKKAAVKTSDEKARRGYVCPNNNGGQWINEPTGHFLYECTGSKSLTRLYHCAICISYLYFSFKKFRLALNTFCTLIQNTKYTSPAMDRFDLLIWK